MRKQVPVEHDIRYSLEGKFSDVIKRLQQYQKEHGDMTIDICVENDYGDHSVKAVFTTQRFETDSEMNARIAVEETRREWMEKRDRVEFERLKARFGG